MNIKHFFDQDTYTLTYVVSDEITKDAIIIDPVLDFDPPSGIVSDLSLKTLLSYLSENSLNVRGILETHAHADHLSSSQLLKKHFPSAILAIGQNIKIVQTTFKKIFNIDYLKDDASQFDLLLEDEGHYQFGSIKLKALSTPGHTPACMTYLIEDALFTGDAIFMPDYGTGRCDFPKGSAKDLYHSIITKIYTQPDETRIYVGHDYQPNGRELKFQTTVGESKKTNIQLKSSTTESEYIQFRESRDKTLKAPRLLLPSIQINIDAGHLPPVEANGMSYLKLPLKPQY